MSRDRLFPSTLAVNQASEAKYQGRGRASQRIIGRDADSTAVVVMACDDDTLPLEARFEAVGDESNLDEGNTTERQLHDVVWIRARDWLLATGVKPGSEFLDDFR